VRVLAVLNEGAETIYMLRIQNLLCGSDLVQMHSLPTEHLVQETATHVCLCCIVGKVWCSGGHGCSHCHQQYLPPETLRRKVTFTDLPF